MTDGTFKSLRSYTLAIFHAVFANETVPIAFSVMVSESCAIYNEMYEHIIELMERHLPGTDHKDNLLTNLPLVTDMGGALEALIKNRNLTWYLCHRHMTENAGVSSQVGIWVSRLLKCSSRTEYDHAKKAIESEIAFLYKNKSGKLKPVAPENLYIITTMLDPGNKDDLYRLDRWARWLRLGCPTTSHAAESVHGHLNAKTIGHLPLIGRFAIVIRALKLRYQSRNTWCGTAVKRNYDRLNPSPEARAAPGFSSDKLAFLRRLHSRVGEDGPNQDLRFHEREELWMEPDDATVIFEPGLLPPDSWLNATKLKNRTLGVNTEGTMTLRKHMGYAIARDLERSMKPAIWRDSGGEILARVLQLGQRYGEEESRKLTPEEEGEWRARAWQLRV
jgi:hypothetical protein